MTAATPVTRVLTGQDVLALLSMDDCIAAVSDAFRRHGEGRAAPPAVMGVHTHGGGFHVKAAALDLARPYFAAKLNANFPANPVQHGLPTIQGVVALCDAETGMLFALMDSIEITALRTAAATAVAVRHLARDGSIALGVAGCGTQGAVTVRAIARVRALSRVWLADVDASAAHRLAGAIRRELECPVEVAAALADVARDCDVIATCTTATTPILDAGDVRPGALVAAVGADAPHKHEITVDLIARAALITDVTDQCLAMGDLHHAIAAGVVDRSHVRATLGEVVAGIRPGRLSADEVIVFDSTGMALQDVAAAAVVYERAVAEGRGVEIRLQAAHPHGRCTV
jgi:ornithine cyclodeaminase/alanine dehydrogenase-like protein (mu-crystallin family)